MKEYKFLITTDHFQFFLADEDYQTDTSQIWTDEAYEKQIACGTDLIAVGTVRYGGQTNIVIEVRENGYVYHAENTGGVIACTLSIPSGVLVLFAPEGNVDDDTPRINIVPGQYNVSVDFENIESVEDEEALIGEDVYRVTLQRV